MKRNETKQKKKTRKKNEKKTKNGPPSTRKIESASPLGNNPVVQASLHDHHGAEKHTLSHATKKAPSGGRSYY